MTELTISELRVIEWGEQITGVVDYASPAQGDCVRQDVTDGQITPANGTDATEDNFVGLVADVDGTVVTVAGHGSLLTLGTALASVNYGAHIYVDDTDKKLTDTSGESTTTKIFGTVEAFRNQGTVYKALRVWRA